IRLLPAETRVVNHSDMRARDTHRSSFHLRGQMNMRSSSVPSYRLFGRRGTGASAFWRAKRLRFWIASVNVSPTCVQLLALLRKALRILHPSVASLRPARGHVCLLQLFVRDLTLFALLCGILRRVPLLLGLSKSLLLLLRSPGSRLILFDFLFVFALVPHG